MKRIALFALMLFVCTGGFAQSVILAGFESFDSADWTTGGYPTLTQELSDGAASTTACLNIFDGGYSMSATRVFAGVVPSDGDYKVTFYYKNGHADAPQDGLQVKINGGATVDIPNTVQATWKAAESGFVYGLTAGDDITIDIVGNYSGATAQQCRFDEFTLVKEVPPVSGSFSPITGTILSGTPTITVVPAGGSGTYTSVGFDVNDDGSIDYTDSTPGDGFTYDFPTAMVTSTRVLASTMGIVITDDSAATGEINPVYAIDNRYGGRESLVLNGDFEDWTGAYPAEWVYFNYDGEGNPNPSPANDVIKDTTDPYGGSNALSIYCEANPNPYRYIFRSNTFVGDRRDYQLTYAGKGGGFVRMYYFQTDDEVTWVFTWHGLFSNSSATVWNEVVDDAYTPDTSSALMAVATHFYGTGTYSWDEVVVTSTGLEQVTAVGDFWDLYR